jgi:hypothetical protein
MLGDLRELLENISIVLGEVTKAFVAKLNHEENTNENIVFTTLLIEAAKDGKRKATVAITKMQKEEHTAHMNKVAKMAVSEGEGKEIRISEKLEKEKIEEKRRIEAEIKRRQWQVQENDRLSQIQTKEKRGEQRDRQAREDDIEERKVLAHGEMEEVRPMNGRAILPKPSRVYD